MPGRGWGTRTHDPRFWRSRVYVNLQALRYAESGKPMYLHQCLADEVSNLVDAWRGPFRRIPRRGILERSEGVGSAGYDPYGLGPARAARYRKPSSYPRLLPCYSSTHWNPAASSGANPSSRASNSSTFWRSDNGVGNSGAGWRQSCNNPAMSLRCLAGAGGLEPTTLGFGDRCSTN